MKKKFLFTFKVILLLFFCQSFDAKETSNFYFDQGIEVNTSDISSGFNRSVYHVYSHGKSGELLINGEWKNAQQIASFLRPKLSKDIKYLNIYGCEFGKGSKGTEAVAYLESELKIQVSASTNITGKDGDWLLEVGKSSDIMIPKNFLGNLQACTTGAPALPAVTTTNNTFCTASNGTITFTATADREYSINGGITYQLSNIFSGLPAGSYSLRVRKISEPGCVSTTSTVTLTDVPVRPAFNGTASTSTNSTSCPTPNGSITLVASAATASPNNEFSIDNGVTWQLSGVFSGLTEGTYRAFIRNTVSGCVSNVRIVTLTGPAKPANAAGTATAVTNCTTPNGSITLNAVTGVEYSIDGGATFSTSRIFNNLAAGTYSAVLRSTSTGCVSATPTSIVFGTTTLANPVATTTNVTTCTPNPNGTITVTAPTVTATNPSPFQYSIDGGISFQTSNVFSNLARGTYRVAYRNANGCVSPIVNTNVGGILTLATTQITIVDSNPCGTVGTGSLTVNVTTTGTEYSFDGGNTWQATNVKTNLKPGIYDVRIRRLGCVSNIVNVAVGVNSDSALSAVSATSTNATSCTTPDGSITINNNNATYEYTINGGNTWQDSRFFTNLAAGTYAVGYRVKSSLCTPIIPTISRIISGPTVATPTNTGVTQPTDCSPANGAILVDNLATPETGIEYSIDGGTTWSTSNNFTGLQPGTYTVVKRNTTTGCISASRTLTLNSPINLTSANLVVVDSTTNPPNGSITVNRTPVANFLFRINGGAWQSSNVFSGLGTGTYTIQIKNNTGIDCESRVVTASITGVDFAAPTVTKKDITCTDTTGSITITSPINSAYEYSIDGGVTYFSGTYQFSNLSAGEYKVQYRNPFNLQTSSPTIIYVTQDISGDGCTDSDGDGIINFDDLDDDNDGILDETEKAVERCTIPGAKLRVGYVPNDRHTGTTDTGYTFDGGFMNTSSVPKLTNLANFGPNGTFPAELELVPMEGTGPAYGNPSATPPEAFGSKQITYEDLVRFNLDIIFIGGIDRNGTNTSLSAAEFDAFKLWTRDPKHVMIVTQAQTKPFGATPISGNVNPGVPTPLGSQTEVFDGPFGYVPNFEQNGSYQGVFGFTPGCSALALARDSSTGASAKKTVIYFDQLYGDIFVADVDMLTSLGGVSQGPTITTNNDKLLVNMFAYAASKSLCSGFDPDSDGDGIPNRLDLDSDDDGCADAIEGGASFGKIDLVTAGGTLTAQPVNINICATSSCVTSCGVPINNNITDYDVVDGQSIGSAYDDTLTNLLECTAACYKPGTAPTASLPAISGKHGITTLGRAGSGSTEWPVVRTGAWTVLEAKTKGFVINRMPSESTGTNIGEPLKPDTTPAILAPVKGMMYYDSRSNCLRINTDSTRAGWKCFDKQDCPTN